jgi:hypothetical protein
VRHPDDVIGPRGRHVNAHQCRRYSMGPAGGGGQKTTKSGREQQQQQREVRNPAEENPPGRHGDETEAEVLRRELRAALDGQTGSPRICLSLRATCSTHLRCPGRIEPPWTPNVLLRAFSKLSHPGFNRPGGSQPIRAVQPCMWTAHPLQTFDFSFTLLRIAYRGSTYAPSVPTSLL